MNKNIDQHSWLKTFSKFGLPGLSLAVFFGLMSNFNWQMEPIPSKWSGLLSVVCSTYAFLIALLAFFKRPPIVISPQRNLNGNAMYEIAIVNDEKKTLFEGVTNVRLRWASPKDFDFLARIAHMRLQGRSISSDTINAWHSVNPKLFRVIEYSTNENVNSDWTICGFYSIIPFVKPTYDLIKNGIVENIKVLPTSISTFKKDDVPSIYIMDVMTSPNSCAAKNAFLSSKLIRDIYLFVKQILQDNHQLKEIGAITATSDGERLVSKFNFSKYTNFKSAYGWLFWELKTNQINYKDLEKNMPFLSTKEKFEEEYIV